MWRAALIGLAGVSILLAGCGSDECSRTLTCDVGNDTGGSSSASTGATGMTTGTGTGGTDMTAPSIVSVFPTDGSVGVEDDAIISITFSEPMDRASVESSFESSSLGTVTYTWPSDSRVEITGSMSYATGAIANTYDFAVTTGARDLAGNALTQAEGASFSTYRVMATQLPLTFHQTTESDGTEAYAPNGHYIGYAQDGNGGSTEFRVLTTYDISTIPNGAPIHKAQAECEYLSVTGTLTSFGDLHMQRIKFASPLQGVTATPLDDWFLFGFAAGHPTMASTSVDLTSALESELGMQSSEIQLRLAFTGIDPPGEPHGTLKWTQGSPLDAHESGGCAHPIEVEYLVP